MVPRHPSCARIRLTEKTDLSGSRCIRCNSFYPKTMLFSRNFRIRRPAMRGPRNRGQNLQEPTSEAPARGAVVGVTGIGPVTSSLSGTRSNQLSYTPRVSVWTPVNPGIVRIRPSRLRKRRGSRCSWSFRAADMGPACVPGTGRPHFSGWGRAGLVAPRAPVSQDRGPSPAAVALDLGGRVAAPPSP